MKIITMTAFALSMAMAGTAFAQTSSGTSGSSGVGSTPSYEATKGPNGAIMTNPSPMSRTNVDKLRAQLTQAGLRDVKVLDTSYLVQAKTQDGNTVIMVIDPPNMNSAAMDSSRDATTTGSVNSGMNSSPTSGSSKMGSSGSGSSSMSPSSSATPDQE